MATSVSNWLMTEVDPLDGPVYRGPYQRAILGDTPYGTVAGTEKRDVSEQLDLLALAETPFVNKIGWGKESGGHSIEWISEDLGPGFLKSQADIRSTCASITIGSCDGMAASQSIKQIHNGSVLYVYSSEGSRHHMMAVTSTTSMNESVSIVVSDMGVSTNDLFSVWCSIPAQSKLFHVGHFANEGSTPGFPNPRERVVNSNIMTILRKDVSITGTMKSTDMYVVGREDRHQVTMRLKEMQRERERAALYSIYKAKTSAQAGLMNGVLGFLGGTTGTNIDTSTYTLTNTAVNTVVSYIWENGGRNLSFYGHINQIAKFTRWDINRIKMRINEGKGGGHISSYLTESGIVIDLIPMGNVPTNLAFVLDTSRIRLRAMKARKAIMQKLGLAGDFDDWQILSEFTMEMQGFNLNQHGMFTALV
ncbi:DUF5309 family protein [Candidatus Pacearchaeota archaeon]|nr:DUF5309 family protein [Candidatus Pacearchaeota archaeon]